MNEICPIPIDPECLQQLQTIEELKEEFIKACSIPKSFSFGVPSKAKTASEAAMAIRCRNLEIRNRLIDNARLVNQ